MQEFERHDARDREGSPPLPLVRLALIVPFIEALDHRGADTDGILTRNGLARETVNDLGLLYTWKGRDPSAKALVFAAHIDVVPIAPGTLKDWTHPPFEGRIADGFVWGRGAMDCKGFLIALME